MIRILAALVIVAAPALSQDLNPAAERAARLIGVLPRIEELRSTPYKNSIDALRLRQDLLEAITEAALDVDTTIAEIQEEQSQIQAAQDYLQAHRGGKRSIPIAPNMLAQFFGRPGPPYPKDVWSHLSASRDQLLEQWQKLGRIDLTDTPRARAKIDFLTASINEPRKLSIEDLADRQAMLTDVRTKVAQIKKDLKELMTTIQSLSEPPTQP